MSIIVGAEAFLIDIPVETVRTDAVQSFLSQQTPMVRIKTDDGLVGLGYSYTIGTGGLAVLSMLREHLVPALIGLDAARIEHVWQTLFSSTRATTVGAITSLALAAIDTALWDLRGLRENLPLWKVVGGYRGAVPVYDTENGWLHLSEEELVAGALASRERGLRGVKIKIGKPTAAEDARRAIAVREAIGDHLDLMVDANQAFDLAEATRRARALVPAQVAWLEEPMPADMVSAHERLQAAIEIPVAVGESLYSIAQFSEYVQRDACRVVQVDVARIGGITPWIKVTHLAEAAGIAVCPHFLMELHCSLAGASPAVRYVEYIPQLRAVMSEPLRVEGGLLYASEAAGLGIAWDVGAIDRLRVA